MQKQEKKFIPSKNAGQSEYSPMYHKKFSKQIKQPILI